LTQKKQKFKYQLSRSEQIFSWTDLRKGCKELTNDKRFSGSVNHSKIRFPFTFVIDTGDPLQEFEFILRTGVMLMAEAQSFFTDESRLAVVTQLSTAIRKF